MFAWRSSIRYRKLPSSWSSQSQTEWQGQVWWWRWSSSLPPPPLVLLAINPCWMYSRRPFLPISVTRMLSVLRSSRIMSATMGSFCGSSFSRRMFGASLSLPPLLLFLLPNNRLSFFSSSSWKLCVCFSSFPGSVREFDHTGRGTSSNRNEESKVLLVLMLPIMDCLVVFGCCMEFRPCV